MIDKKINKELLIQYANENDSKEKIKIRDKIIINNLEVVDYCYKLYFKNCYSNKEDLCQESYLYLIKAIDMYSMDYIDNVDFSTYAVYVIRLMLLRSGVYEPDHIIYNPSVENVNLYNKYIKLYSKYNLNHNEYKLAYLTDSNVDKVLNTYTFLSSTTNRLVNIEIDDILIENNQEDCIMSEEDNRKIIDKSFNCLTMKQKNILLLRFYDELTLNEIAQIYQQSKQAISNIEIKALKIMKENIIKNGGYIYE